jgi:DNA polymerase III delta subunit
MKEIISEAAFRKKIASSPTGGYLFFGEEDYLKSYALKAAKAAVCPDPSLAVFNDMTVDCSVSGFSPDAISSAIAASPMTADTKMVTVSGLELRGLRPEELDAICDAFASIEEYDFNTLIVYVPSGMIDEGYLPKNPSTVLSKLGEKLTPVRFERVSDAKLASWAIRHFEHRGVHAEMGVTEALFNRCGRDMFVLAGEIDKLSFYVLSKGRNAVSREDVETVTCVSEELESFALGNAIMDGNAQKALGILGIMKSRKVEPIIILGELTRTFSDMLAIKLMTESGMPPAEIGKVLGRMHEYKVGLYQQSVKRLPTERLRTCLEMCADADRSIKLSSSGYIEIEKLVCMAG